MRPVIINKQPHVYSCDILYINQMDRPKIHELELELELENCLFDKKKNTNMTQYHTEYMTVWFFLSGDPYKGAERTACVRATHGYYNA